MSVKRTTRTASRAASAVALSVIMGVLWAAAPKGVGGAGIAHREAPDSGLRRAQHEGDHDGLPPGLTEQAVRRLCVEQLESRKSLDKLASGEVEKLTFDRKEKDGEDPVIHITAYFADGTSAPGLLALKEVEGRYYCRYLCGIRRARTEGDADVVRPESDQGPAEEAAPGHPLPEIDGTDETLCRRFSWEQAEHQDMMRGVVRGDYSEAVVEKTSEVAKTATVQLRLRNKDGGSETCELVLVSRPMAGKDCWCVASFK